MLTKTVTVNPIHFKINGNRTRKRGDDTAKEKEERKAASLKMKLANQEHKNRERLIKLLMKRQESNYKSRDKKPRTGMISTEEPEQPHSELRDSIDFLLDLTDKVDAKNNNPPHPSPHPHPHPHGYHNHSIKYYHDVPTDTNVNLEYPEDVTTQLSTSASMETSGIKLEPPKYGCMKNGKLPTYRQFKQWQLTQKHHHPHPPSIPSMHTPAIIPAMPNMIQPTLQELPPPQIHVAQQPPPSYHSNSPSIPPAPVSNTKFVYDTKNDRVLRPTRNRKTLRRTFKIGKSDKQRKVSVLLSNKTIRHQINNKKQDIKTTPISDVKKFLIRRGMIKTGTVAPNEMLRRMYEDATMTAGEIYNHNSEIMVHNFFNDS
jgi:hypothetical protein